MLLYLFILLLTALLRDLRVAPLTPLLAHLIPSITSVQLSSLYFKSGNRGEVGEGEESHTDEIL